MKNMQEKETWICPKCKTYNEYYLETCSCGVRKEEIQDTRIMIREKIRRKIKGSVAVILFFSVIVFISIQIMKFNHPLRKIENRKWRVTSIKFHDGYILAPKLDSVDTCLLFSIRKGEKHYRFSTDDCCNIQGGRIIVKGQKIVVDSKMSTLIGCVHETFHDLRSILDKEKTFQNDPSFHKTMLYTMANEWNELFNDILNIRRVEDELLVWNAVGDTALLNLTERPPDGYGWSLSFF